MKWKLFMFNLLNYFYNEQNQKIRKLVFIKRKFK